MKLKVLKEIIKKKENRSEFAIITNLETGNSEIFESNIAISKDFEKYKDKINDFYKDKKSGVIEDTNIFIESYLRPIKVIIVGAANIAQYLVDYIKNLNFEIIVIDPRGYFTGRQRFSDIEIINKWPNEAFKKINTDSGTALITLTHDTKIDDPALQHALHKKFYYIGALGSKKTHASRCERLKLAGFNEDIIKLIHGPIGINLGGKSASEIALSIAAQLVAETHKNGN
ncbi:XdhC family protein [Candidatus Pelagibacter sp.]|jgi:xanthine dehydrogenase accessory factor|nr:XdhC family protein [Candidatus Pelagibacter sp.]MDC1139244.1 XdhC family protein [Candidatus Pelagibacter sp.]